MSKSIGIVLLVLLGVVGCNYNYQKNGAASQGRGLQANALTVAALDYNSIYSSVLAPQCLRCHSTAGGSQGGLILENYQQVRANLSRIYFRSIEKKDMPSGGLPEGSYGLLKAWIEAGGPERNTGNGSGPIAGPVNWRVVKTQILGTSCLDCHSGKDADAGLDLSSLDVVRKNIEPIFKAAIVQRTMPLEPYASLSEAQKQALMKWISQGMPE